MVKIASVYDLEKFRIFQKYMSFKIFLLGYLCGVSLLLIGILFAFLSMNSYVIYLMMGILLPALMHIYYRFIYLDAIKKNPSLKYGVSQIFTFDELGFELEQTYTYNTLKERYLYKDIYSVVKYREYYFIYVNRSQAFIVSNDNYLLGDEASLDEMFKEYKKDKFIIKRNSKKK